MMTMATMRSAITMVVTMMMVMRMVTMAIVTMAMTTVANDDGTTMMMTRTTELAMVMTM